MIRVHHDLFSLGKLSSMNIRKYSSLVLIIQRQADRRNFQYFKTINRLIIPNYLLKIIKIIKIKQNQINNSLINTSTQQNIKIKALITTFKKQDHFFKYQNFHAYQLKDYNNIVILYYIFVKLKMQIPHLAIDIKQSRKTRKGWLGNKVKQIHLRDDIPCGFSYCHEHHPKNYDSIFDHDPSSEDVVYFIDSQTLIQQTDIIYNCEDIRNLVILQSQLEIMRKNNLNKYNAFKNFIQAEDLGQGPDKNSKQEMSDQNDEDILLEQKKRNFYIFPDIYHRLIQLQARQTSNNKLDHNKSLLKSIAWYHQHLHDIHLSKITFKLLTINPQYLDSELMLKKICQIQSLVDFLKENNSNLLDFIGFAAIQQENKSMDIQNIFQSHLQIQQAQRKIKQGKLFQGKYMQKKSYIKIGKQMKKLHMINNRAMFGDLVAVELAPIQTWQDRTIQSIPADDQILDKQEIKQSTINYEDESTLNMIAMITKNPHLVPKATVKAILRRNLKDYCGSVDTANPITISDKGWSMYEFKPADDQFPNFYIRTYNKKAIEGKRIQVSFDNWPQNSPNPLCHFLKVIGDIGDTRAQGDVILLQHNVQIKQFSRKAYQCLPKAGDNFTIPEEQLAYRLDLRNIDVVSIDPPGCKDIDDALHCIRLPNGNLQIGVHIADVSYYVRPDSALDLEARNRCTTVYLVNRRTDMLPKLLTQNLCSLRANVDRLAFSTIWQIDKNANIINTKYCKSIIRSRNAFTYMQAQQLKDSNSTSPIAEAIRNLNEMAKKFKQKRLDKGALTLASTQVKITLAEQTHSATDVQLYQMVQTNYLIEQFMLLANISVAQKIYERFPAISILRRHTPPKISDLETLREVLSLYGYKMHFQTSKALADSLNQITKEDDPFFNKLIRIFTTRCMNQATYFCSADYDPQQFYHYGLAAEFYTHFTSPIRRYADVLVHRLLAAAIDLEPLPTFMINKIKMTKICEKMNMRNRMARYASRASSDYHTYQFFKDRQNVEQQAVITSIQQSQVTIMLVKYGLECKVKFNQADLKQTIELNKQNKQKSTILNKCIINGKKRQLFGYVKVNVKVHMEGFHKKVIVDII